MGRKVRLLTLFIFISAFDPLLNSTSRVVRTPDYYRVAALIACPAGMAENVQAVDSRLQQMSASVEIAEEDMRQRRGCYKSLPAGIGFGGGRLAPGTYANTSHNADVLEAALGDPAMQRMARYVDREWRSFF